MMLCVKPNAHVSEKYVFLKQKHVLGDFVCRLHCRKTRKMFRNCLAKRVSRIKPCLILKTCLSVLLRCISLCALPAKQKLATRETLGDD